MKSRIYLCVLLTLVLIALGGIWFSNKSEAQSPAPVFSAIANRDCAPWDGSAFTVSVRLPDGHSLAVSIYRSPDMQFPTSFSFPDPSGREGHALLLLPAGTSEPLTGRVWFQRVEEGVPIEGRFEFRSEAGVQYAGRFVAEWGETIVYCG